MRLNVRHDDEGDAHGLFIHGFKPNSAAELQGALQIGDELLTVDGVNVEGKFLSVLVPIFQKHMGVVVKMTVRRHLMEWGGYGSEGSEGDLDGTFPTSARLSPRPQIKSARLELSPRAAATPIPTHRSEHELYQIHDSVRKSQEEPDLRELMLFPAVDIDLNVPKSVDGSLRLYIRHDDEGDAHGLFIHGFKPNSAAEKQGLLKAGDELVTVNKMDVKGRFLEDVIHALQDHVGGSVPMTIRRHLMEENDELLKDMVAHEFEASRKALMEELVAADAADAASSQEAKAARKAQIEKIMLDQKKARQESLRRRQRRELHALLPCPTPCSQKGQDGRRSQQAIQGFPPRRAQNARRVKLHVKHSYKRGLFIHSFKLNSLAEKQGIIEIGDEIINVEGKMSMEQPCALW